MFTGQKETWAKVRHKFSSFDRRMILLHSEKNSAELSQMCSELGIIPCYWFSNAALAMEWYQDIQWELPTDSFINTSKIPQLKYKFSGFNRLISHQRIYRPILTAMVTDLVEPKYLRWSCSTVDPVSEMNASQVPASVPERHKKLLERYVGETDPVRINMNFWELDDDKKIQNTSYDSNRNYFKSTFCHVVTETLFYEPTLHLTEKTFRPIVNQRPFILAGPTGSLAYLRSYGFETFGEFWDESYDTIVDPHERLDAIAQLIAELNALDLDQMEIMLGKMNKVLAHNYHHFYNTFPKIVKDELIQNLDNAVQEFQSSEWEGWIINTLKQTDDTRLARMLKLDEPENIHPDLVYNDLKNGSYDLAENNLHHFLRRFMNASKDDTKESLLATLTQVLK